MYKNNIQYNKLYRNGILYDKAFCNGQQILGDGAAPPIDSSLLIDIPFNGDFENKVVGGIQMVAAGGSPTFSNGAAVFNGSQSIKTATPLDIGTDKVTVCFWMKTTQANLALIGELSSNSDQGNAFYIAMNNVEVGKLALANKKFSDNDIVLGPFTQNMIFVTCVIDRSAANKAKIYINGVNVSEFYSEVGNASGIFPADTFYIGQRGGQTLGLVGELKNFKLFNRVLTQQEINELMLL